MPLPWFDEEQTQTKLTAGAKGTHVDLEPWQQLTMHLPTGSVGFAERLRLWHQKKEFYVFHAEIYLPCILPQYFSDSIQRSFENIKELLCFASLSKVSIFSSYYDPERGLGGVRPSSEMISDTGQDRPAGAQVKRMGPERCSDSPTFQESSLSLPNDHY